MMYAIRTTVCAAKAVSGNDLGAPIFAVESSGCGQMGFGRSSRFTCRFDVTVRHSAALPRGQLPFLRRQSSVLAVLMRLTQAWNADLFLQTAQLFTVDMFIDHLRMARMHSHSSSYLGLRLGGKGNVAAGSAPGTAIYNLLSPSRNLTLNGSGFLHRRRCRCRRSKQGDEGRSKKDNLGIGVHRQQ